MVEFEIKVFMGNKIPGRRNEHIRHWAVFVVNQLTKDLVFLRSFFTEQRAKEFIEEVKREIERGNYECLTLRS